MAQTLGLKPISIPDLPPIVTSPSYTDIFHATVGTAASPNDGFDSMMGGFANSIGAFETDVAGSAPDLADTLNAAGQQDTSIADELAAAVPGATATGDALLTAVEGLGFGQVSQTGNRSNTGGPGQPGNLGQPALGTVAPGSVAPRTIDCASNNYGYFPNAQGGNTIVFDPTVLPPGGAKSFTAASIVNITGPGAVAIVMGPIDQNGINGNYNQIQITVDLTKPGTTDVCIAAQVDNQPTWIYIGFSYAV